MSSSKAIRAVIGRFSYDYSVETIERVMRERPFAFAAIIGSGIEPRHFRGLSPEDQEWFISSEVRNCEYRGADWGSIAPLDEALIEAMRECEAVFMALVSRLEKKKEISYETRKRWYLRHLRFWNDYLDRCRINLYVSAWMPHEIPDIVVYYLCKQKKIPTLYFECASIARDTTFAEHDWEHSAEAIPPRYEELLRQYRSDADPASVPLNEEYEKRYRELTAVQGAKPPAHVNLPSYWEVIRRRLWTEPVGLVKNLLTYLTLDGMRRATETLRRRRIIRARNAFYDAHAVHPDLTVPFVYLPLHFQPEASTTPMAGAYADQILMAQMLNAHLPDGVLLYVKEHPWESSWLKRDVRYYRDLLELPKVRLIARSVDTFALRERCVATATATGTAGMEALFRGKPVFLFGHRFYQYARGVYRIHSSEDCAKAVREIFIEKKRPTLLECRLYLKAMEDTRVHGAINPWHVDVSHLPKEAHVRSHVEAMVREIDGFFA